MAIKIWISENKNKTEIFWVSSALDIHMERVKHSTGFTLSAPRLAANTLQVRDVMSQSTII